MKYPGQDAALKPNGAVPVQLRCLKVGGHIGCTNKTNEDQVDIDPVQLAEEVKKGQSIRLLRKERCPVVGRG